MSAYFNVLTRLEWMQYGANYLDATSHQRFGLAPLFGSSIVKVYRATSTALAILLSITPLKAQAPGAGKLWFKTQPAKKVELDVSCALERHATGMRVSIIGRSQSQQFFIAWEADEEVSDAPRLITIDDSQLVVTWRTSEGLYGAMTRQVDKELSEIKSRRSRAHARVSMPNALGREGNFMLRYRSQHGLKPGNKLQGSFEGNLTTVDSMRKTRLQEGGFECHL